MLCGRAAAHLFVGQHDFTQFSNVNPDGSLRDPNKTIFRFDVVDIEDGLRFEVSGSGFLYKQVSALLSPCVFAAQCVTCINSLKEGDMM